MKFTIVLLALVLLGAPLPASAAAYSGVAALPSVMWITGPPPPPPADAAIHQTMKTFVPALLVVPIGTSVSFPNDDAFYHSVYSDSPSNPFDLGLYDTGPGKSVVFSNPGLVEIHCHVHGSMHATLVVVDGPYVVTAKPNERYRIDGLTPGPHVLHVWTDGSAIATSGIVVK